MVSGMAPVKAAYDPVKALEGMFNGSVTRIAYVIKDPVGYGAPTKTVLTECAKRFHDALDDCEIQLLDAKWYLEHQLKLNRARREAKAREMGTSAKRKHDAIRELETSRPDYDAATKRAKVDEVKETKMEKPIPLESESPKASLLSSKPVSRTLSKEQQAESQTQITPSKSQQDNPPEPLQDEIPPSQDDFAKPTPQATPSGTNDDFNFESMFGDPGADPQDNKDDDLSFDFGMGDSLGTNIGGTNNDPSSLDSLLPGLDSYANQSTDNLNNMPTINQDSYTNFDLPVMQGTNDFDEFLNDDSLGHGNYEDNVDLSEEALNITDFDDTFLI